MGAKCHSFRGSAKIERWEWLDGNRSFSINFNSHEATDTVPESQERPLSRGARAHAVGDDAEPGHALALPRRHIFRNNR